MSKGYNRDDMDDREFVKILASAEQLRLRGNETEPWADCYSDMNFIENVSSVPWRVSGRTRCSLAATVWRMCRLPIIL